MVVDTSALIAIFLDEPERAHFNALIEGDPVRLISAASLLEASMVLGDRFGSGAAGALDQFLKTAAFDIVAFDAQQARIARTAFQRYGKGRHRAGLNFGDCFSYALAKSTGEALLYKGGDFARTDITPVM